MAKIRDSLSVETFDRTWTFLLVLIKVIHTHIYLHINGLSHVNFKKTKRPKGHFWVHFQLGCILSETVLKLDVLIKAVTFRLILPALSALTRLCFVSSFQGQTWPSSACSVESVSRPRRLCSSTWKSTPASAATSAANATGLSPAILHSNVTFAHTQVSAECSTIIPTLSQMCRDTRNITVSMWCGGDRSLCHSLDFSICSN